MILLTDINTWSNIANKHLNKRAPLSHLNGRSRLLLLRGVTPSRLQLVEVRLVHSSRDLRSHTPIATHVNAVEARALEHRRTRSVYASRLRHAAYTSLRPCTPASGHPATGTAGTRRRSRSLPRAASCRARSAPASWACRCRTRCRNARAAPPTPRTRASLPPDGSPVREEPTQHLPSPACAWCCRARWSRPPPAPTDPSPRPSRDTPRRRERGWGCASRGCSSDASAARA